MDYDCDFCKKCTPEGKHNIGKRVITPTGKGIIVGLDLPCSDKAWRYMVKMDEIQKPEYKDNTLGFWKKEIMFLRAEL